MNLKHSKNKIYKVVILFSFFVLLFILSYTVNLTFSKKSNERKSLNQTKIEEILSTIKNGVGSEFSTESYYKEKSSKYQEIASLSEKGSLQYFIYKMGALETLIAGNFLTKLDEKEVITVKVFNESYSINQELVPLKNKIGYDTAFSKSLVATYNFFEQYCFRTEWFLESDWTKDETFKKFITQYPNEKRMSIFLGFSEKFEKLPLQDNVVIGLNTRVTSYLLDSFKDKLSESDRDILVKRLISLRQESFKAPISKIYGTEFDLKVHNLVVNPSIEYAYGTNILFKYRPDLVSKETVSKTYEETILKIKKIVDKEGRPIYIVNKFMWIHLMYLGYLYEQEDYKKVTNRMYDLVYEIDEYSNKKSEYVEGRQSVNAYEEAGRNELGSWDQIRQRAFKANDAIRAEVKNGGHTLRK